MTAESLIRFARAYCSQRLPWFAPALYRCRIHFTDQVPIAAIDQHFNIYFNTEAILEIDRQSRTREDSLSQVGFIWIHEISHLLREHADRARELSAEARLWNVAADLEINDSSWPDLHMPSAFPGLQPGDYNLPPGQIAESYYLSFAKDEGDALTSLFDVDEGAEDLPDEGSGVHGVPRPWEISDPEEAQQLDDMEVELVRRSVANEMKNSKERGSMPGGWSRWAEEKLRPRVDWRQVLRHRMSQAINQGVGSRIDYSYRRPSRRQTVFHPILPPSLGGELSARIACVVDTSGSMTPQQLAQAVAEVCSVLEVFRIPVTIIPCDARAYDPIQVATPSDYFKLQNLTGGGGTNMIVGIEAALQLKPRPDAVLVLTDGYTPFPHKLYKTPVIFGIFTQPNQIQFPQPPNPPWRGDFVVEIPVEGR
ncbi:MAG: VWA-like domain-containing protein [Saprospiraceae bacterium]|nr:hypothetical protein [Lewinella sp.]